MTPTGMLDRAKQGDPRAIATLLNHRWMAQGIKIRARSQADHLDVLLECEEIVQQDDLTAMVQQELAKLAPASIHTVKLYGKTPTEATPRWSQEWTLLQMAELPAPDSQPLTPPPANDLSDPDAPPQSEDLAQSMTRRRVSQGKPSIAQAVPNPHHKPGRTALPTHQRRMPNRAVIFMAAILTVQVAIVIAALLVPKPRVSVSTTGSQTSPSPNTLPSEPSLSEPAEVQLAKHLKASGARMYGTYWCGVCTTQKQMFGSEAFSQVDYIECDPRGSNPQPTLCSSSGIGAYPTWEIGGQFYVGGFNLEDLADMSNYSGSRNFTNMVTW